MKHRRHQVAAVSKRNNLIVGVLVIAAFVFVTYLAFFRPDPFTHRYTIKAVFTSTPGVRPGLTPVRIAGVDVGKVEKVESYRGGGTSLVTMQLEDRGLPVHADTQLRIRPRLFLEGNAFVQMSPGSPGQPELPEGSTLPLRQTSVAVAFPQVLGALTADTRRSLQQLLQNYGSSLRELPTPEEDATQMPQVQGESAGDALNDALSYAARAMPTSAQVSDAFTGREQGQLRTAIRDFGLTAEALDSPQLPAMLANLRRASGAFASESAAVTDGLRVLPGALASSRRAFERLTVALPPARALSRASAASLSSLPAMFTAGVPWLAQARPLLGAEELGADLPPMLAATRQLAAGARPTGDFLSSVGALSRCSTRVMIPTANARIEDGPRTSGTTVFAEFLSALVGISGQGQNFDGNGFMIRGNPGGGATPVATRKSRRLDQPMYGNAIAPPLGTRPKAPAGSALPLSADVPCASSKPPDVNGGAAAPGPKDGS
jgi:phospholipid/cholesterol/gamma-HCH transport system substrate-binding protein